MNHPFEKLLLPQEIRSYIQDDVFYLNKYTEELSDDIFVEVDKRLVKLIKVLWTRKIYTKYSCQGYLSKDKGYRSSIPKWWNLKKYKNVNYAYISFLNQDSFEQFLVIVNPTKHWSVSFDRYTIRFPPSTIRKILRKIKAHAK